jgi:hypothetical protein
MRGEKFKYDMCDVVGMHISAECNKRCNMNTKKTIGISMIALLVVAMGAGMAAAAPHVWAVNETGCELEAYNLLFGNGETVYATGTGTTGFSAKVYVVLDRSWANGDTMDDVVGGTVGYTTLVTGVTSAAITDPAKIEVGVVGTGTGQIPTGDYDLFYDINGDGIYTVGTDDVEHHMECEAFGAEVPEFATIAIPVLALLGLVLFMRRKKD